MNYHLTQLLSGHSYFRRHSQRYDNTINAQCPTRPHMGEDAEHVFFHCRRFDEERRRLNVLCQEEMTPENIIGLMLTSEPNWHVVASFAQAVVTRLRHEEMARRRLPDDAVESRRCDDQPSERANCQIFPPREVMPNGGPAGKTKQQQGNKKGEDKSNKQRPFCRLTLSRRLVTP
uniref:Reverse transcriptase zinc-binding domain-containing protein n=1 Tax=Trichogramma kaykai TaxID=54128 RepID=A0ABD2W5Z9_9HYME